MFLLLTTVYTIILLFILERLRLMGEIAPEVLIPNFIPCTPSPIKYNYLNPTQE